MVLQVLDARDPLGCRCKLVEEAVLSAGTRKKLVLVLNKIDLVPKDVVEQWLKYLRNEFPTIAFKASTQTQRSNLAMATAPAVGGEGGSEARGAGPLMRLLANYSRSLDIKTAIRVGVVGYPNVGKSSIINSLKRGKACGVGSTPGFTKTVQEVELTKHITLLDSPGIVFASSDNPDNLILRNCVRVDSLPDPIQPVDLILRRCNHYQVPENKKKKGGEAGGGGGGKGEKKKREKRKKEKKKRGVPLFFFFFFFVFFFLGGLRFFFFLLLHLIFSFLFFFSPPPPPLSLSSQLMEKYCVPKFANTMEFLQHLARRLGKMKKGGVPDCDAAARGILQVILICFTNRIYAAQKIC